MEHPPTDKACNVIRAMPIWTARKDSLFANADVPCMNILWNQTVDQVFSKIRNNIFHSVASYQHYAEIKATAVWNRMYTGDYASERILELCNLFESTQLQGRIETSCALEWGILQLHSSESASKLAPETLRNYISCWQTLMHHDRLHPDDFGVYIRPSKYDKDEVTSFLEHHCMHYCTTRNDWTPNTKKTFAFNALSACKHIGYVLPEFYMYCKKLSLQARADTAFSRKTDAELEKELMCKDGKLLTTGKILDTVNAFNELHDTGDLTDPLHGDIQPYYHNMLLALFACNGNRPQDYIATLAWTEDEFAKHTKGAVFCLSTGKFCWREYGKTKNFYIERTSNAVPTLLTAIRMYHELYEKTTSKRSSVLLPLVSNKPRGTETLRKHLTEALEVHGFPRVTPTNLRHLYETHMLYFEKVAPDVFKQLMDAIGHSAATSTEIYSQKYRGLILHPLGYGVDGTTVAMEALSIEDVMEDPTTNEEKMDTEEKEEELDNLQMEERFKAALRCHLSSRRFLTL